MFADTDVDELVLSELDEPWRCASAWHDHGEAAGVPHRGDARYYQFGPCRHTTGFRCAPSAEAAMTEHSAVTCSQCRSVWPATLNFIEL
jgi:hypothetical protein